MRLLTIFLALSILTIACKNKAGGGQTEKSAERDDLPKDFLAFYQQFHTDSAYQMAHIEWPLKGEKSENLETGGTRKVLHIWEPENWTMLRLPDLTDVGLKSSYETTGDALITERLQYPMVNFGLERQFFKEENNEWKLIYYSEMQELK